MADQDPPDRPPTLALVPAGVAPPNQWKPGQSGNPLGRSTRKARARDKLAIAFREHTDSARVVLATVMLTPTEKTADRIAAAREILNRGWGLAPIRMEIRDDEEAETGGVDWSKLSEAELWALRELTLKARGETG